MVDDMLVDRAFVQERQTSAMPVAAPPMHPFAPHNAGRMRWPQRPWIALGALRAVAQGLRDLQYLGGHRIETVAQSDGITRVDDSKATNPNAVNSSMRAYEHIVWIAGGQTKGTSFDEPLTRHAKRLRGVVLLGVDRQVIADALRRHALRVLVVKGREADWGDGSGGAGGVLHGTSRRYCPARAGSGEQGHGPVTRRAVTTSPGP